MPRFFRSVSFTDSHKFAPLVTVSHRPSSSFWPYMLMPRAKYKDLLITLLS
jgi:hypothetical protein